MTTQAFSQSKQAQIQKQRANGALQRKCDKCRKRKRALQRSAFGQAPQAAPPIVHEALRSPGVPLDAASRAFMEPRFGHDFSRVRIHIGPEAVRSARAVGARAYAISRHVVFSDGQYTPQTPAGRHLLAHELAHVIQQEQSIEALDESIRIGSHDEWTERKAQAAADMISSGLQVQMPLIRAPLQLQRWWPASASYGDDPLHQEIIESFRRERGLPQGGVDPLTGERVGPSEGEIKYQLSTPNQLARLSVMTPWQLSRLPASAFAPGTSDPSSRARFEDFARASLLARLILAENGVTFDIDSATAPPVGREPSAAELAILDRSLSQILRVQNVRGLVVRRGRARLQGPSSSPSLQGRVRILSSQRDFGIKRYQLEMSVVGLAGQNITELDRNVRDMWTSRGISTGSRPTITDQERRVILFLGSMMARVPGFYHPNDDMIYLEPNINLQQLQGQEVARHETVHLLGASNATLNAFRRRYGSGFLPYWSTFEEGMAELITQESIPSGQIAPQQPGRTTTTGTTSVTVNQTPAYGNEVRIMRQIMRHRDVGRENLFRAYFTGAIPAIVLRLLEEQLGRRNVP